VSAPVDAVLARPDADAVLDEARMWLTECVWADVEDDALPDAVDALTDTAVLLMVDAEYGGGLDAFVAAFATLADAPW
jgi:hypothetical protein